MKYWLSLIFEPSDLLLDHARCAEELGYEGVVLADHIVIEEGDRKTKHPGMSATISADLDIPDPFLSFAAMAAVTTKLRFLSQICIAPLRDPFVLAKQAGTLAILSQDRFVLGAGVGWLKEEFDTVGHDFSTRGKRLDEMIPIMRDFWDDGYAEFHGEYYDFARSGMFPVPKQQVPIWIGGHSKAAARRAASCDGYLPMRPLDDETRAEFKLIDELRRDRGTSGPFERMISANRVELNDPWAVRRLEETEGITSTVIYAWPISDHSKSPQEKRSLAAEFAEKMIHNG